ncbi:hypothetical protein ACTG9Q_05915 [Actinokineospora sp. 24-640]
MNTTAVALAGWFCPAAFLLGWTLRSWTPQGWTPRGWTCQFTPPAVPQPVAPTIVIIDPHEGSGR